jgi:Flp pilus assembly protein TadB
MVVDAPPHQIGRKVELMLTIVFAAVTVAVALAAAPMARSSPRRPPTPIGASRATSADDVATDRVVARGGGAIGVGALGIGALGVGALLVVGPFGLVVVAAGAFVWRRWQRLRRRRQARRAMEEAVPDLIDLLVVTVRAGFTPALAFELLADLAAAPLREGIVDVVRHRHAGERFADALAALPARCGPALEPLSASLARVERYGEPLAPVLERLADEARDRRRHAAEAAARVLPVRLCFPLVCCTLPAFVLLAIVPLLGGAFSSLRAGTAP